MGNEGEKQRSHVDFRGLLLADALAIPLAVIAFFVLASGFGPTQRLHPAFFYPLCLASGAMYAAFAGRRRPDLGISHLGGGGAVAAILPSCILSLAGSSTGASILDIRGMMNPRVFILWMFLTAIGAFLGCIGALVLAMVHEARVIRRYRSNAPPRPMPRTGRRR